MHTPRWGCICNVILFWLHVSGFSYFKFHSNHGDLCLTHLVRDITATVIIIPVPVSTTTTKNQHQQKACHTLNRLHTLDVIITTFLRISSPWFSTSWRTTIETWSLSFSFVILYFWPWWWLCMCACVCLCVHTCVFVCTIRFESFQVPIIKPRDMDMTPQSSSRTKSCYCFNFMCVYSL